MNLDIANKKFKTQVVPSINGSIDQFPASLKPFSNTFIPPSNQSLSQSTDFSTLKTSGSTKSSPRTKDSYADRFIPLRGDSFSRKLIFDLGEDSNSISSSEFFSEKEQNSFKYQSLLEGQILGVHSNSNSVSIEHPPPKNSRDPSPSTGRPKLLTFKSPGRTEKAMNTVSSYPFFYENLPDPDTPNQRKIPEKPFKVLEAPYLEDDYYLNLIDWSKSNILGVALRSSIYLWTATNSTVMKLCETPSEDEIYTSVAWNYKGDILATGLSNGYLNLWDVNKMQMIRDDLEVHQNRIGVVAWNTNHLFASGSRDKTILVRDIRIPGRKSTIMRFTGHRQEVCGLKWSPNDSQMASGGNDNKLFIWNLKKGDAEAKFGDHKAAVKALAWSPHQNGLLLSGGGNNDKTIKFWNTLTLQQTKSIFTGSQVCNLIFSRNSNEFVSTHGFSNNQIIIWKYPELEKIGVLEGHSSRVLYLALSPDGETIVTGAGDETLRFWHVFPPLTESKKSPLLPSSIDLR